MINNKEIQTISTPPTDLLKILIIQRRNDLIDAIEHYYKNRLLNAGVQDNLIRARTISLLMELGHAYVRWQEVPVTKLIDKVRNAPIEDVLTFVHEINEQLDLRRITRVDTRDGFDRTKSELENENML